MGLGNLGIWEILVLGLLVLIVFGPRRLPEIARSLGKGLREFKRGMNEIQRELEEAERDVRAPGPGGGRTIAGEGPPPDGGAEAAPGRERARTEGATDSREQGDSGQAELFAEGDSAERPRP